MKRASKVSAVAMATMVAALVVAASAHAAAIDIKTTIPGPGSPGVAVYTPVGGSAPSRPSLYGDAALDIRRRTQSLPSVGSFLMKTMLFVAKVNVAR